jgi:hypothetical protein
LPQAGILAVSKSDILLIQNLPSQPYKRAKRIISEPVPTIAAMESKPMESGAKPSELRQDNMLYEIFTCKKKMKSI